MRQKVLEKLIEPVFSNTDCRIARLLKCLGKAEMKLSLPKLIYSVRRVCLRNQKPRWI